MPQIVKQIMFFTQTNSILTTCIFLQQRKKYSATQRLWPIIDFVPILLFVLVYQKSSILKFSLRANIFLLYFKLLKQNLFSPYYFGILCFHSWGSQSLEDTLQIKAKRKVLVTSLCFYDVIVSLWRFNVVTALYFSYDVATVRVLFYMSFQKCKRHNQSLKMWTWSILP